MNDKLSCEIIRDLLPSYADGLTSEATNKAVEEHMEECYPCKKLLEDIIEDTEDNMIKKEDPVREVDYLKKVRLRARLKSAVIAVVMLLLGVLYLGNHVYYRGKETDPAEIKLEISAEGDTIIANGNFLSDSRAFARAEFSDGNGIVQVTIFSAPKAFFNSGEFEATYETKDNAEICQVKVGGYILWEDGNEINEKTARLFSAVNPFVGDMPANGKIASILGISDRFGSYSNELQTASEPYGWTLRLDDAVDSAEESSAIEDMRRYSYILLGTIGNLSYVTWSYSTEEGQREMIVNKEEATNFLGYDIKQCSASPVILQELLDKLDLRL